MYILWTNLSFVFSFCFFFGPGVGSGLSFGVQACTSWPVYNSATAVRTRYQIILFRLMQLPLRADWVVRYFILIWWRTQISISWTHHIEISTDQSKIVKMWAKISHPTGCQRRYQHLQYDVNKNICDNPTKDLQSSFKHKTCKVIWCIDNSRKKWNILFNASRFAHFVLRDVFHIPHTHIPY